jgi:hypothetical protein
LTPSTFLIRLNGEFVVNFSGVIAFFFIPSMSHPVRGLIFESAKKGSQPPRASKEALMRGTILENDNCTNFHDSHH